MKTYELNFTEFNGYQEYMYNYLVYAKDLREAKRKSKVFLKDWYSDGKEIEPFVFEYDGGGLMVRKVYWREIKKEDFEKDLVERFTIN